MAVAIASMFNSYRKLPTAATALDTGISMTTSGQPIVERTYTAVAGPDAFITYVKCNSFKFNIASDAALAVGQKILTMPEGFIVFPMARIKMTSTCASGLSATAGEVGLGSVIASGANATLGAVGATSEDIMEGQTIANHVAATALQTKEMGHPVGYGAAGAAQTSYYDGTGTACPVHFNIASTWNQTAAEDVTINSLEVWLKWEFWGDQ